MLKIYLLILNTFFPLALWGQSIQVDQKSLADFTLAKLKDTPENAALISWGHLQLQKAKIDESFLQEMNSLLGSTIVTQSDREFLIDLMTQALAKSSKNLAPEIQAQICRWESLSPQKAVSGRCLEKNIPLQKIKDRYPEAELLVAEDMAITLKQSYSLSVDDSAIYNWKILSNTSQPISFRGSFQDLQNQNFLNEKIVQGDCDSFTHSLDDFEVISRGEVIFPDGCKQSLNRPETSRIEAWYKNNKHWVIPVGIAVVGAALYSLKDKKIIIDKP